MTPTTNQRAAARGENLPLPRSPESRQPVVFDLEVLRGPDEVGGWGHAEDLGLACAVTMPLSLKRRPGGDSIKDKRLDGHRVYLANDIEALADELNRAAFVVGFNHVAFDYAVLRGAGAEIAQRRNVDLARLIPGQGLHWLGILNLGRGKKLDSAALPAMFGRGETGAVVAECRLHVELTRDLYLTALRWGGLRAHGRAGCIRWRKIERRKLVVWQGSAARGAKAIERREE